MSGSSSLLDASLEDASSSISDLGGKKFSRGSPGNRAILESGVNLVDTAEQYPIPSDDLTGRPEGYLGLGLG